MMRAFAKGDGWRVSARRRVCTMRRDSVMSASLEELWATVDEKAAGVARVEQLREMTPKGVA